MARIPELQNQELLGSLSCADVPFLPACQQTQRILQHGGRYARYPPTECVVGTVSGSYANGDPFMANMIERSKHGYPDRVHRNVILPNGMLFQLENTGRSDGTFDPLEGNEQIALDMVESGLSATFHLNKQRADTCRAEAHNPGILVEPAYYARDQFTLGPGRVDNMAVSPPTQQPSPTPKFGPTCDVDLT